MENITTIQIRENVKRTLERLKEKSNESYEEVIVKLVNNADIRRREQEELLIEGCKEMYNDMIEINKEWESVDADIDWEWNDNGNKKRRHSSS